MHLPVLTSAYLSIHPCTDSFKSLKYISFLCSKTLSSLHVSQPRSNVVLLAFTVGPYFLITSTWALLWPSGSAHLPQQVGSCLLASPLLPPSFCLSALPVTPIHFLLVAVQLFIHSNLHPLRRLSTVFTHCLSPGWFVPPLNSKRS